MSLCSVVELYSQTNLPQKEHACNRVGFQTDWTYQEVYIGTLGWIRTTDRLSNNQMRYQLRHQSMFGEG